MSNLVIGIILLVLGLVLLVVVAPQLKYYKNRYFTYKEAFNDPQNPVEKSPTVLVMMTELKSIAISYYIVILIGACLISISAVLVTLYIL